VRDELWRRAEEVENGEANLIPAEELFQRLREELRGEEDEG
jgi:hypothetical protein